jgi:transcriptional regulator with XRE-family HTH domain
MEPLPNKTLGQLLRELRQNADLSLRDLGEKLKDHNTNTPVSAAFLSDIENGRRFPSDDMIEKLAEILGADPMELRRCDPRGPAKEMQELATMNPKYAFAFRRAVDFVNDQNMLPQEFIRRVENSKVAELIQKIEARLDRPLSPVEIDSLWAAAQDLFPSPPPATSNDPET